MPITSIKPANPSVETGRDRPQISLLPTLRGPRGLAGASGDTLNFSTRAFAETQSVSGGQTFLRTAGYSTVGDRGGALYKKVSSGRVDLTTADAKQWQIVDTILTPIMFGAIPGDGLSDRAAIVLADAAAAPVAGMVFFPAGIYELDASDAPLVPSMGVKWAGENRRSTYIRTASPTADIIDLSSGFNTVEELGFSSAVTRSGGAFINISGGDITLRHLYMTGCFTGITLSGAVSLVLIDDVEIINPVAANGIGVYVSAGLAISLRNVFVTGSGTPHLAGIYVDNCGDLGLIDCGFLSAINNMMVAPGNGQIVVSLYSIGSGYDQASNANIALVPSGTGYIGRSKFSNGWASGGTVASAFGFLLVASGAALIAGISITDMDIFGNGYGINADGAGISDLIVNGNKVAGSSAYGIRFSDITGGVIAANRVGAYGGFGVNAVGIALNGATDKIIINGNDLRLNTAILSNTASGTNRIEHNQGYNPVGVSAVSPGASPWTHTNGPSPATLYIIGGTVSNISVGGVTIATATSASIATSVQLGPNESCTITYTVAPTVKKAVH